MSFWFREAHRYFEEPQDYSGTTSTGAAVGTWSPTIAIYEYYRDLYQKRCTVDLQLFGNPSNATTYLTFTLPFVSRNDALQSFPVGLIRNNGAAEALGTVYMLANSSTARIYRSTYTSFTAGAEAGISARFTYRI